MPAKKKKKAAKSGSPRIRVASVAVYEQRLKELAVVAEQQRVQLQRQLTTEPRFLKTVFSR